MSQGPTSIGGHRMQALQDVALLFPGQGSQTGEMRTAAERFCPELAALAIDAIGDDPFARAGEGTMYAQPAIFCASVAGWRSLACRVKPGIVAGHSLGEFAALVAAGVLDPLDALRLVIRRGELMQRAHEQAEGGMVAVRGGDLSGVQALAEPFGVVVANDNAPGHLVLSGASKALKAVSEMLRTSGLRTAWLPVAGAFHSPVMADAARAFREALTGVRMRPPNCATLCTTTVAPFNDVADDLVLGITRPVRWRQSVQRLHADGIDYFIEVGPGRGLTQLVRRTLGNTVTAVTATEAMSHTVPSFHASQGIV